MPRGVPRNWTREELERVRDSAGDGAALQLADEYGLTRASIYSLRKRIRDQGIDAIVESQENRYRRYVPGGSAQPETLEDQLRKVMRISVSNGGRGDIAQYGLTIPSRIGEAWVARFGRQVRFEFHEDALLIRPVVVDVGEIPSWLTDSNTESSRD